MNENITRRIIFYLLSFAVATLSGLITGFTSSHTPPVSFLLASLGIIIGGLWLTIDFFRDIAINYKLFLRRLIIHLAGLALNALIIVFIFTR